MKRKPFIPALVLLTLAAGLLTFPCGLLAQTNPLSGDYFGSVLVTSPADLGNIDLAFHLELDAAGNVVPDKSYVILEKTVLFPKRSVQVNGKDVGPRIASGQVTSSVFTLTSDPYTTVVAGKTVTRKIALANATITERGNSIRGTYTETMTGYLPNAIKVTGEFVLFRPVPLSLLTSACQDKDRSGSLSLAEIRAGGNNLNIVEFVDISCAMRHYRNPALGLTVSPAILEQALKEYKTYQTSLP